MVLLRVHLIREFRLCLPRWRAQGLLCVCWSRHEGVQGWRFGRRKFRGLLATWPRLKVACHYRLESVSLRGLRGARRPVRLERVLFLAPDFVEWRTADSHVFGRSAACVRALGVPIVFRVEAHVRFVRNVPLSVNLNVVMRFGRWHLMSTLEVVLRSWCDTWFAGQFGFWLGWFHNGGHLLTSVEILARVLLFSRLPFHIVSVRRIIIQKHAIRLVKLSHRRLMCLLTHGRSTCFSIVLTNIDLVLSWIQTECRHKCLVQLLVISWGHSSIRFDGVKFDHWRPGAGGIKHFVLPCVLVFFFFVHDRMFDRLGYTVSALRLNDHLFRLGTYAFWRIDHFSLLQIQCSCLLVWLVEMLLDHLVVARSTQLLFLVEGLCPVLSQILELFGLGRWGCRLLGHGAGWARACERGSRLFLLQQIAWCR